MYITNSLQQFPVLWENFGSLNESVLIGMISSNLYNVLIGTLSLDIISHISFVKNHKMIKKLILSVEFEVQVDIPVRSRSHELHWNTIDCFRAVHSSTNPWSKPHSLEQIWLHKIKRTGVWFRLLLSISILRSNN